MNFMGPRGLRAETAASSFEQVIHAARQGDGGATSTLYLDHVAMVYGYLRACGLADADDVTSEVFIGMLRGLERFSGDELDFRRWLMTIAHRRLVDHRRRHLRNRTDLADASFLEAVRDDRSFGVLPAIELDSELVEAFGRLTEPQREVLALRFIADVSIQGVADIVGRPRSAVKSLQNRGLESLRRHMAAPKAELHA